MISLIANNLFLRMLEKKKTQKQVQNQFAEKT